MNAISEMTRLVQALESLKLRVRTILRRGHCLLPPRARGEYDEKTADRYAPVSQIIDCARVLAATLDEVCA